MDVRTVVHRQWAVVAITRYLLNCLLQFRHHLTYRRAWTWKHEKDLIKSAFVSLVTHSLLNALLELHSKGSKLKDVLKRSLWLRGAALWTKAVWKREGLHCARRCREICSFFEWR